MYPQNLTYASLCVLVLLVLPLGLVGIIAGAVATLVMDAESRFQERERERWEGILGTRDWP